MFENHKLYFAMAVPEFDKFIHVEPEVVQAPPPQAPPAAAGAGDQNLEKEPLKDTQRFEVDKYGHGFFNYCF